MKLTNLRAAGFLAGLALMPSVWAAPTDRVAATTSLGINTSAATNLARVVLNLPDGRTLAAVTGAVTGSASTSTTATSAPNVNLVVINADGTVADAAAGIFNGSISALHLLPDGKILVVGAFSRVATVPGVGRSYVARLNTDLSIDTSFAPSPAPTVGPDTVATDSQGNIYLGGSFTNYGGESGYNFLVRLYPDGTLDRDFNRRPAGGSDVNSIVLQPDGKLLVVGDIDNLEGDGLPIRSIYRLNVDGTLDTTFTPPSFSGSLAFTSAALDSQGRIILNQFNPQNTLFRLLPTGALDASFTFKGVLNNRIRSVVVLPGDQLLVGGSFTSVVTNGVTTALPRIFRLNENGTVDESFSSVGTSLTGPSSFTLDIIDKAPSGRILLAGAFSDYIGVDANRLLILEGTAPSLAFASEPRGQTSIPGATVTFSTTAIGGVSYQWRRNGINLSNGVAAGGSIIGGATTSTLTITGVTAADAGTVTTGYSVVVTGASSSITSKVAPLTVVTTPEIMVDPVAVTTDVDEDVTLSVVARGANLLYQWTLDGVNVGGATSSTLTLNNVTTGNAGQYRVLVSNGSGSVTSSAALLTVGTSTGSRTPQTVDLEQPAGRTFVTGDIVTLAATASSGLTDITFAYVSGPATLSDNTLTITGTGTITVSATQAGNGTYASATAFRTFSVTKASQTITFNALVKKRTTSPAFDVIATSSSNLPITFEIPSDPVSPATVGASTVVVASPLNQSKATVTLTGAAGTVTVIARQAGDDNIAAADSVIRTFLVEDIPLLSQTITFAQPAPRTLGSAPATVSFRTSATGLTAILTVVSGPATVGVDGKTLTLTGAGNVVLRVSQPGDGVYSPATSVERTLVVKKGSQKITFDVKTTHLPGGPTEQVITASHILGNSAPSLTAVSSVPSLPVTLTLKAGSPATLSGDVLTITGPGKVIITASQAGNDDYLAAASVVRTISVNNPVLGFTPASMTRIYTGQPLPVEVTGAPVGFSVVVTYKKGSAAATATAPTVPGTYAVTATLGDFSRKGTLIIKKKTLTVTPRNKTVNVGTIIPTSGTAAAEFFLFDYDGFVDGEDASDLDATLPIARTSASSKSNRGTYKINARGGLDDCYLYGYGEGVLTLVGLGGTYEALISDPTSSLPVGHLTLTMLNNSFGYTGKLTLANEVSVITIRSGAATNVALVPNNSAAPLDALTSATGIIRRAATTGANPLAALELALTVNVDGTITGTLDRASAEFGELANGHITRSSSVGTPGVGDYTLVLAPPTNHPSNASTNAVPDGAGHATVEVTAAGLMKISGKLPDGTTLTTTSKMSDSGDFLIFVKPHGTRSGNYLSGELAVTVHPTVGTLRRVDSANLIWNKPLLASDKTYALGFGPLITVANLEAWQAPISGTTLAQRLRLPVASGEAPFVIDFISDALSQAQIDSLATVTTRVLLSNNTIKAVATVSNPAVFTLATPISSTGAFSGSFKLTIPPATTTTTITFSGVLRQGPAGEANPELIGRGHFLLPASTGTTTGEIRFEIP